MPVRSHRLPLWILAIVLSISLAIEFSGAQEGPATGEAAAPRETQPGRLDDAEIEALIRQLGAEEFQDREAATKRLAEVAGQARAALERATRSTDPETANRARGILGSLPKLTHRLVDALNQPISGANVTISFGTTEANSTGTTLPPAAPETFPGPPTEGELPAGRILPTRVITYISEAGGGIPMLEPREGNPSATVLMEHPEYGRARVIVNVADENKVVCMPLVRRGTEAYKRAVKGKLVNADGKPVAEAQIHCHEVRTPGEGLIQGQGQPIAVLSNADGEFSFYLPRSASRTPDQVGELIPANSNYTLLIEPPGEDDFPVKGRYSNLQPLEISIPRAMRRHRFRFESTGGGWVEDPHHIRQISVQHDRMDKGYRQLVTLDPAWVLDGRKLVPGTYQAEDYSRGRRVAYEPLVVTDQSPEVLEFRLPRAVTYRGRVVHGVTGEGVAGAFVVGWNSTARQNLALLTDDDWKLLAETPSNPPLDHPAIQKLQQHYGVRGFVRTDTDGQFAIEKPPGEDFYGILAFDRESVPYRVNVNAAQPDDKHQIDCGELPLFPAARLVVKPVFAGTRLSVAPRWLAAADGQPEWFGKFSAVQKSSTREFEYVHWLAINEPQPILVPADVRLQIRFETPYDDEWGNALVDTLQLKPGTTHEHGALTFAPYVPIVVQVIDARGKPVEGVPVRQKLADDNAWSVAHNTDNKGLARFFAAPKSAGEFWVSDLPGSQEARMAKNLFAKYQLADEIPADPDAAAAQITLMDEQLKVMFGKPAE
jgi:hypothetical protein